MDTASMADIFGVAEDAAQNFLGEFAQPPADVDEKIFAKLYGRSTNYVPTQETFWNEEPVPQCPVCAFGDITDPKHPVAVAKNIYAEKEGTMNVAAIYRAMEKKYTELTRDVWSGLRGGIFEAVERRNLLEPIPAEAWKNHYEVCLFNPAKNVKADCARVDSALKLLDRRMLVTKRGGGGVELSFSALDKMAMLIRLRLALLDKVNESSRRLAKRQRST